MFNPQPARHTRFRQTRVLIVGCGDVGLRAARQLLPRCRVLALTSQPGKVQALREAGIVPLVGNLDQAASLGRLAGLATHVLHLAPPPGAGATDPRTGRLLAALSRRGGVRSLVYGSTTGVYGDAQGALFDETRAVAPATDRGRRRVHAEALVRWWGRREVMASGTRASVLRIPGIYALDREGGDPRDRVRRGSPLLRHEDDVYTNHIHADDLARACVAALWRGKSGRVVHACDDTDMRMGEYFDWVADHFGLPRSPRVSRVEAAASLSPMQLSFMSESRRLMNRRLKSELKLRLRYPSIQIGLS
ncbi:MAG TPA: SDR family oxidoreductase [Aquabacterium sp.]|uniref:SDR family oxidoreductase n=1 Tax=Aquabacterium sp. TaxID=1872578 RepID=UPI002E3019BF|nr:SDR family oxidoreductase [Aquabacterium sp.]HEX5355267.1 SDR family oxidoreductase [Aquabacterium sp.]